MITTDGYTEDGAEAIDRDGGADSSPMDATDAADAIGPDAPRTVDGGVVWPENGHTYLFVRSEASWFAADEEARAMGGHLVTLSSGRENDFVFSLLGGTAPVWIGGRQPPGSVEPDGGWTWVTGEPFDFTAWASGQPNNEGNEDAIRYGSTSEPSWNDQESTTPHPYVVEFE